jgi:hypothetical protein
MISGLVNYGLGHNSLEKQWQALYYFCGAVTIAWSIPIYFFMPTSPLDPGRSFNDEEKEILRRRFRENPLSRDRQPFIWTQCKEALLDWKTYLYLVMSSAIYVSRPQCTPLMIVVQRCHHGVWRAYHQRLWLYPTPDHGPAYPRRRRHLRYHLPLYLARLALL